MKFLHLIPNLDRHAPSRLQQELKNSQMSIKSAIEATDATHKILVRYLSSPGSNVRVPNWAEEKVLEEDSRDSFAGQEIPPLLRATDVSLQDVGNADYVVFTNSDICLAPQFYEEVSSVIASGTTSFSVHRRTIHDVEGQIAPYESMLTVDTTAHEGSDCFVFPAQHLRRLQFDQMAIGIAPIGDLFLINLALLDTSFAKIPNKDITFHFGDSRDWNSDSRSYSASQTAHFGRRAIQKLQVEFGFRAVISTAQKVGVFRQTWNRILLPMTNPGLGKLGFVAFNKLISVVERSNVNTKFGIQSSLFAQFVQRSILFPARPLKGQAFHTVRRLYRFFVKRIRNPLKRIILQYSKTNR